MAIDWGAFVSGAAKTTLNSWEEREKADRTMAMQRELEKLRRETSDYEFNRDIAQKRKEVKNSTFDPETGEVVDLNAEGTVIGRRRDAAAMQEYKNNQEKVALDRLNTQSQIDARKADTAQGWAQLADSRADRDARTKAAAGVSDNSSGGVGGAASNLLYLNKSVVDALIADGVPAEEIGRTARLSITHAANPDGRGFNPDRADSIFLDALRRLRGGLNEEGQWSLDTFQKSRKPQGQ